MAIAPLPEVDVDEVPWPRPALRLLPPLIEGDPTEVEGVETGPGDAGRSFAEFVWDGGDGPDMEDDEAFFVPAAPGVSARRRPRVSSRVRRRRLALGALVVGLLVALAFPVSALGGRPVPATTPAAGSSATRAGATVYVVQPGDTLWSIASRIDGTGDPRSLVKALEARLGTSTVVPGQRITIP